MAKRKKRGAKEKTTKRTLWKLVLFLIFVGLVSLQLGSTSWLPNQWLDHFQDQSARFSTANSSSTSTTGETMLNTTRELNNNIPSDDAVSVFTSPSTTTKGAAPTAPQFYFSNVVLLGQFNYNLDAALVRAWVEIWKSVFAHVQVRGAFSADTLAQLHRDGIAAFRLRGEDDKGWSSIMRNMADTLRMYRHAGNDSTILGVLQIHDDLLLNVTHLQHLGFPSNDTIFTLAPPRVTRRPLLYFSTNQTQHRKSVNAPWKHASKWPNVKWRWWPKCMSGFGKAVADDTRAHKFADMQVDGEIVVPFWANAVGDFSYVPLVFAAPFGDMADWLVDHNVYLECGTPTLHAYLQDNYHAKLQFVHYCTNWGKDRREYPQWVMEECVRESKGKNKRYFPQRLYAKAPYGIFHPLKISLYGPRVWKEYFERLLGRPGVDPLQPFAQIPG